MDKADGSRLCVALSEVAETCLVPAKYLSGGAIGAQIVYGLESSMMVAVRQPEYHSLPHAHDAEQLNYVLDGELWVFVEEDGFRARKGDVFRIPRNAIHWSWVKGDRPCVLLEMHTPPLIGDEGVLDGAVALIKPEESRDALVAVPSNWPEIIDRNRVERAVMSTEVNA